MTRVFDTNLITMVENKVRANYKKLPVSKKLPLMPVAWDIRTTEPNGFIVARFSIEHQPHLRMQATILNTLIIFNIYYKEGNQSYIIETVDL